MTQVLAALGFPAEPAKSNGVANPTAGAGVKSPKQIPLLPAAQPDMSAYLAELAAREQRLRRRLEEAKVQLGAQRERLRRKVDGWAAASAEA